MTVSVLPFSAAACNAGGSSTLPSAAGQSADDHHSIPQSQATGAAHRLQRVDSGLRQAGTVSVGNRDRRAQPWAQRRLLGLDGRPDRPALVRARDHPGGRAAGGERLDAPAQPVERLDARVVHDGAVAAVRPDAQRLERHGGSVTRAAFGAIPRST